MAFGNWFSLKSLSLPEKLRWKWDFLLSTSSRPWLGSQSYLIDITGDTTVALITLEILRCLGTVSQNCDWRPDVYEQYILVIWMIKYYLFPLYHSITPLVSIQRHQAQGRICAHYRIGAPKIICWKEKKKVKPHLNQRYRKPNGIISFREVGGRTFRRIQNLSSWGQGCTPRADSGLQGPVTWQGLVSLGSDSWSQGLGLSSLLLTF